MGTNVTLHYMQKVMFVYNFNSGGNFCGENFFGTLCNFFCG